MGINIFNIDNMVAMAKMPDNVYDLAIVDPLYGINAPNMQMGSHPNRSKNDGYGSGPGISTAVKLKGRLNQGGGKLKNRMLNTSEIGWDNEKPSPEYFKELFRVSKNQIIWGGNYFDLPPTRCIICWDKMQPWENFSQWEMAWTSFDKPAKMYRISNTGGSGSNEGVQLFGTKVLSTGEVLTLKAPHKKWEDEQHPYLFADELSQAIEACKFEILLFMHGKHAPDKMPELPLEVEEETVEA